MLLFLPKKKNLRENKHAPRKRMIEDRAKGRAKRKIKADSRQHEREGEIKTGIMGTFLLQPHHKQISRSSSQAINIQGISFLF